MPAAPTIDELLVGDDAGRWTELGFTVSEESCCEIGGVRLRFPDGDSSRRGILGWTLRDIATTELNGLPTTVSGHSPRDSAPVHPNGVVAIDHIVAASPSLDRSIDALQRAGLDLRRVRDQPTPAGAPRQAFFRLGAEILELIQEPEDSIQRAGGGRDHPARFWGLAVRVEDLDRTVRLLAPHVSEIRPAVQPGRRIATLRRSAGLTVPLALMSAPAKE
jgi:catechol 2,3-dioxygenase-like lactoylglutathione lyase family enzyme